MTTPPPSSPPPVSALPAHLTSTTNKTQPTEFDLSPSKARAHATTAQAWTQVEAWLRDIITTDQTHQQNTSLPPFEHNPATLAYLQSLMHASKAADRARQELHASQVEQVRAYEAYREALASDPGRELLREVEGCLSQDGEAALQSLGEACVLLQRTSALEEEGGVLSFNGSLGGGGAAALTLEHELGRDMLRLSADVFELQRLVESLRDSEQELLRRQTARVSNEVDNATEMQEREQLTAMRRQQTSQYTTQTKHLSLKLAEYNQRIAALAQGSSQGTSLRALRQRQKELQVLEQTVKALEQEIGQYHGLPPDIEASRAELRRAQAELETLKRQREELFSELAAG